MATRRYKKIEEVTCPRPECAAARGGEVDAFEIHYWVSQNGDKYAINPDVERKDIEYIPPIATNLYPKTLPISFKCPWCGVESSYYLPV